MKRCIYFLSILLTFTFWVCTSVCHGQSQSPAAQYITNQVEKQNKTIAVFRDFGDGENYYTQRAALNPSDVRPNPEMDEKAPSPFGASSIKITYPLSANDWNGYIFMTGKLPTGSTEPELDFGRTNTGYDLSGAKRLKFKARGEVGGERVRFYMGGLAYNDPLAPYPDTDEKHYNNKAFVALSAEWTDYVIDLSGLDLSRIASGFGWVTNEPENRGKEKIVFYLDEIIYEFDEEISKPLLLRSHEPVAVDREEAFINNFAYIYDNAIAALVLSYTGEHAKARQIADALVFAANNDRFYNTCMLRNAYANGHIQSFPGWLSPLGKVFAKLPGFYDTASSMWWEDRYAVSMNTGNIGWSMLALMEVYRNAPQQREYLTTACGLGDYILDNFFSPDEAGGGFTGGFEGWEPTPEKLTYKSTEHAIDLYVAYKQLAELTLTLSPAASARYQTASIHARNFLMSMYDPIPGCFYTGTMNDGRTINKSMLPLDTNTWGILALSDDTDVADLWDSEKVVSFIEQHFRVGDGVDFNEDCDGIWYEGAGQYALVLDLLGKADDYAGILACMNNASDDDGSITAADRDGVTTGFDVTIATNETETGLKAIPWLYNKRGALGATAWLAFAQLRINPYTGKSTDHSSTGKVTLSVSPAKVWSSAGSLHIRTAQSGVVRVYNFGGTLVESLTASAGETKVSPLPTGRYVVTLNGNAYKIAVF
ncbi:MAG: hypothetical protein LBR26_05710 [Prevotella sp.]|jgi:hypothetical protein|nr:hypothetical protein [Prevotella sp.]